MIQFATAALVAPRTYEIGNLLRGQAGSEHAMAGTLPAGARFVLLDRHLVPIASGADALGLTMQLRIAGAGRVHNDASAVELAVTPGATALTPLAPVQARARRSIDGVRIRWIRRTRGGGDGWDAEPPLGEASEAYRIDILDGVEVKRQFEAVSSEVVYSAADETADFGGPQAALTLRIVQLSAATGPGHPLQTTVAVLS